MPISAYYDGHGSEVMSAMRKQYGSKRGESIFYALANKRGEKPAGKSKRKRKAKKRRLTRSQK